MAKSTTPFDVRSLRSAVSSSQFVLNDEGIVKSKQPTVCDYIIKILADSLGIRHAFGCPGDFAFAFDDAIENCPSMEFVLTTNELNAAYAADAYARIHGSSVLTTTYGVGELSAINGVMGSKAERVGTVFHLVGEPGLRLQHTGRVVHHTLGANLNPEECPFLKISEQSCCTSLRVTDPGSVPRELDAVVEVALRKRQPCYILVPKDIGIMEIPSEALKSYTSRFSQPVPRAIAKNICHAVSVESELKHGVDAVLSKLSAAKNIVVLVSYMVNRLGLEKKTLELVEKMGAVFYSTPMDKGTLSEQHPLFGGMYKGKLSFPSILEHIESAEYVLDIGGTLFDDLSSGWGTATLLKEKLIQLDAKNASICIGHPTEKCVQNMRCTYHGCYLGDVLDSLLECGSLPKFTQEKPVVRPKSPWVIDGEGITYASIGDTLQSFLQSGDTFVVEVGTISGFLSNIVLPEDCQFVSQTLWGSIGYATPAVLGACLSTTDRSGRVVMVTGDGAHLMTANEIGTMGRYETKPIIVVLNNGVYGVEEFLEKNEHRSYNDLCGWEYADAAKAMLGRHAGDWIVEKVHSVSGLVSVLHRARDEDKACYVEAMMEEILLDPLSTVDLGIMYFDLPPRQ